jgi:hypothetical protein
MASSIRYRVPYEIAVKALDASTGKRLINIFYVRSQLQTVAPPAYGFPIAGSGSTLTLVSAFAGTWRVFAAAVLNERYNASEYIMRAIVGKRFGTPLFPIAALVTGTPVTVQTGVSHGFSTGNTVIVAGVTVPGSANATWVITVLNSTTFTLNGSNIAGVWSGDGTVQRVQGQVQLLYADTEIITTSDPGGVLGDALPLFATSSIRRLNSGVGRQFRSRFSLSPMSEADVVNGGFTAAQKAVMVTALNGLNVSYANGGTDATSGNSNQVAFAKSVALTLPSPFGQSDTFTALISSYQQQRNTGSLTRRKPRLTSIIAP